MITAIEARTNVQQSAKIVAEHLSKFSDLITRESLLGKNNLSYKLFVSNEVLKSIVNQLDKFGFRTKLQPTSDNQGIVVNINW